VPGKPLTVEARERIVAGLVTRLLERSEDASAELRK
jgi:N-acyl-D-amino-acid deacylase